MICNITLLYVRHVKIPDQHKKRKLWHTDISWSRTASSDGLAFLLHTFFLKTKILKNASEYFMKNVQNCPQQKKKMFCGVGVFSRFSLQVSLLRLYNDTYVCFQFICRMKAIFSALLFTMFIGLLSSLSIRIFLFRATTPFYSSIYSEIEWQASSST